MGKMVRYTVTLVAQATPHLTLTLGPPSALAFSRDNTPVGARLSETPGVMPALDLL